MRILLQNVDAFSTAWVAAWPSRSTWAPDDEFAENVHVSMSTALSLLEFIVVSGLYLLWPLQEERPKKLAMLDSRVIRYVFLTPLLRPLKF